MPDLSHPDAEAKSSGVGWLLSIADSAQTSDMRVIDQVHSSEQRSCTVLGFFTTSLRKMRGDHSSCRSEIRPASTAPRRLNDRNSDRSPQTAWINTGPL